MSGRPNISRKDVEISWGNLGELLIYDVYGGFIRFKIDNLVFLVVEWLKEPESSLPL